MYVTGLVMKNSSVDIDTKVGIEAVDGIEIGGSRASLVFQVDQLKFFNK